MQLAHQTPSLAAGESEADVCKYCFQIIEDAQACKLTCSSKFCNEWVPSVFFLGPSNHEIAVLCRTLVSIFEQEP